MLAAPAAAAVARGSCEWRAPAHDPFTGDVPGAVDRYTDIPAATRSRLKARMQKFAYDDIVAIKRDSIEGNFDYEPALLDMHFGKGRLCGTVTRKSWKPDHEERGLAYCEDGQCIVVPLVCRNVSRIIRRPGAAAGGSPGVSGQGPLVFDPPAAGLTPGPEMQEEVAPLARPLLALPSAGPSPVPSASLPPGLPGLVPGLPAGPPVWPNPGLPPLPPAPAVPEPTTVLLWLAGLAVLCRQAIGRYAITSISTLAGTINRDSTVERGTGPRKSHL